MSHSPERKEKNCLNCGTIVQGKYCHICGQENIEPMESFWHLVTHFFYDITHFDGKFFHSLKYLFLRPGFLSQEYIAGRRASYLNPIRMYVFTSAFFFLLFFSFLQKEGTVVTISTINGKTIPEINAMDSAGFAAFTGNINKNDNKPAVPMTREEFKKYEDSVVEYGGLYFTGKKYRSRKEYDSLLAAGIKKHNWFERQLIYKEIGLNVKYHNNTKEITNSFRTKLLHSIPQMLFISLPLLALVLKLIYIRRKQFFYISHAIFSIYFYIFLFLAMLVLFGISKLNGQLHWGILNFISGLLYISLFVYEYAAMRNFYKQGWLKTFFKFLLINVLFFIAVGVLFVIFVFFSLFEI